MDIIKLFQQNIIDNTTNSINFYLTKTNGMFVLHISNKFSEKININNSNKTFFKKLTNMLFDTNKKTKTGCFNYEHEDDEDIYNKKFNELVTKFLLNEYIIILIDKKFNPLSYLCINNNTLWSLCTNNLFRKKGYMTLLLKHLFKLIHNNKLLINIDLPNLLIYIKKNNPIKKQLNSYYNSFGFNEFKDLDDYIIMKYKC
jgi:hypothetical protein